MNYKNDPLFRFLQAGPLGDGVDLRGKGEGGGAGEFCRMEEGGAMPDADGGGVYGKSLAMVYSPYQHFGELYEQGEALCRGTVFRELDKPFLAAGRGL